MGCQACGQLLRKVTARAAVPASSRSRSGEGDMIGRAIAAVRSKGYDHVGLEGADGCTDLPGQHIRLQLPKPAVTIVQADGVLNAEVLASEVEFLLTHAAKGPTGGHPCTPDLPRLTPGPRHHHHLRAAGG